MTTKRERRMRSELDALYAELPTIECRNQCHDSCGPIRMTDVERDRILERGYDIPQGTAAAGPGLCPALSMLHQCSVYDIRPMICRLWGLTESMPCTFGCRPEGGLLSDEQTYELLARAMEISGDHAGAARIRKGLNSAPVRENLRAIRREQREGDIARSLARKRAYESGKALFVIGRGRLSKEPPASGANSL